MKWFTITYLVLSFCWNPAQAQRSYTMVCRGGAGISFTYFNRGDKLSMWFRQGTGPSSEPMLSGQCTWLDRGLHRFSEPSNLYQDDVHIKLEYHLSTGTILEFSSDEAPWINMLWHDGNFAFFSVYNDREGGFKVTQLGP